MTQEGWIKLYRRLAANEMWLSEPFTRGQAWVDLLLLANHKDRVIRVRGHRIEVKRGQVGWSQQRLAERWKWSRKKVAKFLDEIEQEQQVEQQKNNVTSIITLINFEEYQQKEQQKNSRKIAKKIVDMLDVTEESELITLFEKFQKTLKKAQQKEQQPKSTSITDEEVFGEEKAQQKEQQKNSRRTLTRMIRMKRMIRIKIYITIRQQLQLIL